VFLPSTAALVTARVGWLTVSVRGS